MGLKTQYLKELNTYKAAFEAVRKFYLDPSNFRIDEDGEIEEIDSDFLRDPTSFEWNDEVPCRPMGAYLREMDPENTKGA